MALSGEVRNSGYIMVAQQFGDEGGVTNVAVGEGVVGAAFECGEAAGVAGVGERIQIDERAGLGVPAGEPVENET